MICPFHDGKSGEPTCTRKCPFWAQDEGGKEECAMALNLAGMFIFTNAAAHALEGIRLELVGIRLALEALQGMREENLRQIGVFDEGETFYESERADDTEIRRTGETSDKGTRTDETEGGNVGVEEGADDRSVPKKRVPKKRTKKGGAGQDGSKEPDPAA